MAAGVSDHVWTLEEVLALLERPRTEQPPHEEEPPTPEPKPYRRRVRH